MSSPLQSLGRSILVLVCTFFPFKACHIRHKTNRVWFVMQDSSCSTVSHSLPWRGRSLYLALLFCSEKPCTPDAHSNSLTVWIKNDPIQYLQLNGYSISSPTSLFKVKMSPQVVSACGAQSNPRS